MAPRREKVGFSLQGLVGDTCNTKSIRFDVRFFREKDSSPSALLGTRFYRRLLLRSDG